MTGPEISPHDLDAEKAVLGAVLINNHALVAVERIVQPTDFFRDAHCELFRQMLALASDSQAIDILTIKHALGPDRLERVGGPAYITSLIDGLPRSSNVEHYANIVKQHSRARVLIAYAKQAIQTFKDDPGGISNGTGSRFLEAVRREVESAQTTAGPDRFTTAAASCNTRAEVPVLLEPYLVKGTIGSIVAKIKMGKTSFALESVRCLRRARGFCGHRAPERCRVLYATEQPEASFTKQLKDAGLQDDEGLIVTYLSSWMGQSWDQIAPQLIDRAMKEHAPLLVVDTGSRWFGFKGDEENQAGSAEHVQRLQAFTAQGGTVLIPRHGRKSGGTANDAARGSSAIDGAVDYILHLHRPAGQPADVREIECVGRFDMPDQLLIRRRANFETSPPYEFGEVDKVHARYVFEAMTSQTDTPKARIRAELLRGARTAHELAKSLDVSVNTINRTLAEMPGEIVAVGKGGPKNNATVYGLSTREGTLSSPNLLGMGKFKVQPFRHCREDDDG